MKTKRKTPDIRFRGFSDDWEQRKLSDYKDVRDGTHDSPKFQDEGYPLVTSKNLTRRGLDMNDVSFLSKNDFDEINKRSKVNIGDILFAMIGTIGNPIMVKRDDFAIKNVALIKYEGEIINEFLIHVLNSDVFERYIHKENTGGTQKFLALGVIRDFSFMSPSLKEQQQIGKFFKEFDDVITLHQCKLQQLKEVKRGMLLKMFPEDKGNPNIRVKSCDEEWSTIKLKDIGDSYNGLTGKTKKDFGKGLGEFVTYLNVFNNPIADISLTENVDIDKTQNEVKRGDVFFTVSSETPHEVGMASVWLDDRPNVYLNSFCFGFRPTITINSLFLSTILHSNNVRKQFTFLAQGISRYNISKVKSMEIRIGLPSIEEQEIIGDFFRKLDRMIELQEREIELLEETKKGFLQKMFV